LKIQHSEDYRKLRAAEYPKIGDQLDAIYKLAQWMKNSQSMPVETLEWLDQVAAVKSKYPK
jgi:hypothetical protein